MPQILKLYDTQSSALEALGRYKFLNSSQLSGIVGTTPGTVTKALKPLRDEKFVDACDFGATPGNGKLASLYYLTPKGTDLLEEMGVETVRRPVGRVIIQARSYLHRVGLIDFHVALERHLEEAQSSRLLFFETDFDFQGANRGGAGKKRQQMTKIYLSEEGDEFIIPDIVFALEDEEGETPFFVVEYHRGADSLRSIQQLYTHAQAVADGRPTLKYQDRVGERSPRILAIYEEQGTRDAVARRMLKDERLSHMVEAFVFATLDDVKESFSDAFKALSGKPFSF